MYVRHAIAQTESYLCTFGAVGRVKVTTPDLDRRISQRHPTRVPAVFVPRLGKALSDPGTSVVDLDGVTTFTNAARTVEQRVYQGVARVGDDLAQEFAQSAPISPLISLRSH